MKDDTGLRKLTELLNNANSLREMEYDDARITQWRMTVRSILEARFGSEHSLCKEFAALYFMDTYSDDPHPPRKDHNAVCQYCVEQAINILVAACDVWPISMPATPGANPAIHVVNNNNATATSSSNASATVQFPLRELLKMVDENDELSPEERGRAKEHIEDLDGELRKTTPRWEKIRPAFKFLLDTGKEIAIKVAAAVLAKLAEGQLPGA